jgi:3-isopropylmalate/(R)-2-methylmalate dehydratase small subunit
MRWGIQAIIGESFAEIFAGNCNTLGIPAVRATEAVVAELMDLVEADAGAELTIDLDANLVRMGEKQYPIDMPSAYREALVSGKWDSTAELLENKDSIRRVADALPYVSGF